MVTVALPSQAQPSYDQKRIEKIVDHIFPCTAEAAFIKSVHDRNACKLRMWRNKSDDSGKKVESFSEAVALIRRCFLAKSYYYVDCAERLTKNLQTEGYDPVWNVRIAADEEPTPPPQEEEPLPDWEDFLVEPDAFPAVNDETVSQYLDPSFLLDPPEELHRAPDLDVGLMDEPMDYEICTSDVESVEEYSAVMTIDFSSDIKPKDLSTSNLIIQPSSQFQNDHFGLAMDCDQDGLPIDFLE
ncbi:hypothetical protein PENTCL1PPCAC_27886 [Pristionchus entomophagus]|uniref:Uncharacterized protein n=1 Tax=Pristionchus entomophagus TaxID=358040 RepID=A0AAV5UHE1_9BILA|nr:hypothetical protein PENTCL1PPCAC_27886 [Pristionchus entomophagus]